MIDYILVIDWMFFNHVFSVDGIYEYWNRVKSKSIKSFWPSKCRNISLFEFLWEGRNTFVGNILVTFNNVMFVYFMKFGHPSMTIDRNYRFQKKFLLPSKNNCNVEKMFILTNPETIFTFLYSCILTNPETFFTFLYSKIVK